jgi:hypothetical protein
MTIRPKDRKLAELILFISERSEGDPPFGADKLSKLLFNADFSAFRMHKKSITGQAYEKCYVCPAPKRLAAVREQLVTKGELAIREREPYGPRQYRSFALRLADHAKFTADELALVTSLIATNWGRSAWDVKNTSEEICGWEQANDGDNVPYEIAYLSKRPPTEKERRRALKDIPRAKAFFARQKKGVET